MLLVPGPPPEEPMPLFLCDCHTVTRMPSSSFLVASLLKAMKHTVSIFHSDHLLNPYYAPGAVLQAGRPQ